MSAPDPGLQREPHPGTPPAPETPTTWRPVGNRDALTARSPDQPVLPGQSVTGHPDPAVPPVKPTSGRVPETPGWRHVASGGVRPTPSVRGRGFPLRTAAWLAVAAAIVVALSVGVLVVAGALW